MSQFLRIETLRAALVLQVDEGGRLLQRGFGAKERPLEEIGAPAYAAWGDGWTFGPALQAVHADGNTSTDFRFVRESREGDLVRIELKDPQYPFFVDLLYRVRPELDVFEAWTEIRHEEAGSVRLEAYASSAIDFGIDELWLTQFHGAWADEANMLEERITPGIKILDSKIGVRAQEFRHPWFLLARGAAAQEDAGEVFGGSLAWPGSFQLAFERLPPTRKESGRGRVTCGINPFASAYHLVPGERFETPKMVWGWSDVGTGTLSRNLQRYVREEILREADEPRAILLNNWEATYFDFDEKKIVSLFDGAKDLGMELFLLDDGWFGTKYPRDGDTQGLGDWTPDAKKLPNGIGALVREAEARGLRFGIWLEPEMVSPRSELFEAHPDWAIQQPGRELDLWRNQLVLDLTNPEVEAYVWEIVDRTLRENPGISYVKWDCNRYLTQPGSPYLGKDRQSHLGIEYVRALGRVFDRLKTEYPHVEVMMCAGGGGRVDYWAMRYAHEFWPSDQTDPARRIFIQWGYSHFFPAISAAAHVTETGDAPLKFAFDVAMSARMGMDMDVDRLSAEDRAYAAWAIGAYKEIREVVQLGEQYRLESPYDGARSALLYAEDDRAVVFVYSLGAVAASPLRLKGLDPAAEYRVREIAHGVAADERTIAGATLLDEGLPLPAFALYGSAVFELRKS